jgi:hypothetical protein
MPTATSALYDNFLANALGSTAGGGAPNVDWLSDDIRAALTTSSYTISKTADDFWNDVVANEIAGTGGYTTNGQALANKTLGIAASVIKLDADDAVWATATFTARRVVVYNRTPATDATRPLISYQTLAADLVGGGGEYRVAWHANGIVSITVSAEA